MPPKKKPRISRNSTRTAIRKRKTGQNRQTSLDAERARASTSRAAETPAATQARVDVERARASTSRAAESPAATQARVDVERARASTSRAAESPAATQARLVVKRTRASTSRAAETPAATQARVDVERARASSSRAAESPAATQARLEVKRARASTSRAAETRAATHARLGAERGRASTSRAAETPAESQVRINRNRGRKVYESRQRWLQLTRAAFLYDPAVQYQEHPSVNIGGMTHICVSCGAHKWKSETKGMCCRDGKVKLPSLPVPPEPLKSLVLGTRSSSKHFLENIRKYNSSFQMTSFGADYIERDLHMFGKFKVQGQVYHQIGSLLPLPNQQHKFLQIYFMGDLEQQARQRQQNSSGLQFDLLMDLQDMIHACNPYVKLFKTAIENMPDDELQVVIRADKAPPGEHERRFNVPTTNEVAILIVGNQFHNRDIVIQKRERDGINVLKKISDTNRSYDALQYPLLFPLGDDGYNFQPIRGHKVTCLQFYAFRLMQRTTESNHLICCGALFHQFVVDMYAKIESERLRYISLNQKRLRVEEYAHLRDAIANDRGGDDIGRLTILPSSFTGGPRYMQERTQDAMTYVRKYGTPDLFITFTCNPKWPEIVAALLPGQTSNNRTDLEARVFRQKLITLMNLLKTKKAQVFGEVRCYMYSVEWQKRGLPHAHILLWLEEKIRPNQIDSCISAELPDPNLDPVLFDIVSRNMLHGPCGNSNKKSVCMKKGICTKRYPRQFVEETQTGGDGYPLYRRRHTDQGGFTVKKGKVDFDNRWVVPYNPLLSRIFNAHLNVEYCNSVKAIKYICKYVNKGSDQAVFELHRSTTAVNENDEVKWFQMGRYISSNEAVWKILEFPIHERYPTVTHLAVHLENGQRVFFHEGNAQERAANPPPTTLTAFFRLCQVDEFAQTLLYCELPMYYTWQVNKSWKRRARGQTVPGHPGILSDDALGRVYTVHPNNSECYYLRLLLHTVRGPTSFQDLRTDDGQICDTFHKACQKKGLLENDDHWNNTMTEAASVKSAGQLRNLFAIIITNCAPSNPRQLWENHKESMAEDILHKARKQAKNETMVCNDVMFNKALIYIEDMVMFMVGKSLDKLQLGLPVPLRTEDRLPSREVLRETSYDVEKLAQEVTTNVPQLSPDQTVVFNSISDLVESETGGIIFIDAPGGTGKTYLINLLLAKYRSQKMVSIAVATSGIAATLLPGGRTAHSAFKLPLNLIQTENPVCNINKGTGSAQVMQMCKIIVWDECTMAHKSAFEALNRTLQDLRGNDRTMGGVTLVLSGDFRQTLPIILRGTPADEIKACLKQSSLWHVVKKLSLTTNHRVRLHREVDANNFANNLLRIGDGKNPVDVNGNMPITAELATVVKTSSELIDKIFSNLSVHQHNTTNNEWLNWLCDRAILAPLNADVDLINTTILEGLPGPAIQYNSVDIVTDPDLAVLYPTEFLNSLQPPGLPPHSLVLKVGAPIMLLRNLDPPRLCNGTRLCVKKLLPHIIEATIMTGCAKMEDVFIPRIPLIPNDVPYEFKRLQFPIRLSFAMTINKAQGQSFKIAGIDLRNSCFSHGQLYVACSRVGGCDRLFILAPNDKTTNVVYQQALE